MPVWNPSPDWEGLDAYVVGGGPSLRRFPWDKLKNRNVIGCNGAFSLGSEICPIVVFGDLKWWKNYQEQLKKYTGIVVTNAPALKDDPCPWLWKMERISKGLDKKALGWNGNTGSLGINLALILGARRVYLLGFDMKLSNEGKANWHHLRFEKESPVVYPRFILGYASVKRDLPRKFPGREIINVTDDSDLNYFPKETLAQHFKENQNEQT